jgi:hypothetical protein
MMSNLALSLTGDQITRLTQDKRRELAAQWGSHSAGHSDTRRTRAAGLASRVSFRRAPRPDAC